MQILGKNSEEGEEQGLNLINGNSADVELMFRFLEIYQIKSKYINKTLVKMRYGGASNKNILSLLNEAIILSSI